MRIRAIRGKNLASLAGEFVVDFSAEPLASAGVFAISGPTGAGKSTLLDAMCLALYHETPRLKAAQELNVSIPDVHEQSITPRDPRNLLRRGCGEGWAEVVFEDMSGVAWRARWSVARARSKADGRLQAASAELVRCEDQYRFDGKLAEIQHKLVELTGLSFEQFCRSVLLAQNEFSALLKARQNERADLLEALTGSEIFQRISTLAHERHAEEQRQLQGMEQELKLSAALDDEQRAALLQRVNDAQARGAAAQEALRELHGELRWHVDGERLHLRLAAARGDEAELAQQIEASRDEQQQLQRWSAAEPLRPLADAHTTAGAGASALQAQLPALAAAVGAAAAGCELAQARATTAAALSTNAQAMRSAAQPVIAAARAADAALRQAANSLARITAEGTRALASRQQLEQQLTALAQRAELLQQQLAVWSDWQLANPAFAGSDSDWATLGARLEAAAGLQQRVGLTRERLLALKGELADHGTALGLLEQAAAAATIAVADADAELAQAQATLMALDPAAIEARRAALERRGRMLQQLQSAMVACSGARQRRARHAQALNDTRATLVPLRDRAQRALQCRDDAAREAAAATAALERASLLAHAHTERLRESLVAGEPCPVCGSKAHPGAGERDVDARTLLDLLGGAAATAAHAAAAAIAEQARLQGEIEAGQRELTKAEAADNALAAELERAHASLLQAAAGVLPGAAAADIEAALPALAQTLDAESATAESDRAALARASQSLQTARARHEHAAGSAETARRQLQAAQTAAAPLRKSADALQGECDALAGELTAALQSLQRWPALTIVADAPLAGIFAQWQDGEAIRGPALEAATQLQQIEIEQQGLRAARSRAEVAQAQVDDALRDATEALETARRERQALLAEADVERFAERLDAELAAAMAERERCQQAAHQSALDLQRAQSAQQQCEQQLASSAAHRLNIEQQLQQQLAELALALDLVAPTVLQLQALLASRPADLAARQAEIARQQRAWLELRAQLGALHSEIQSWQQQAGSARAQADVAAALAHAEAEHTAALHELGALAAELKSDDQRRQRGAEQRVLLQQRRSAAQRWALLDDLIGARDGAKFKRYAQQFTLEVLIEYANEHLVHLARRYRLRRGNEPLSLLVIDADLGDEVRSVHSLSGGETFLVSLALALGLASLSSQRLRVESLFIDEGFGSLDADTLNMAMEALDRLQAQGRRIGVISHVHDMAERIGVQVRVEPVGAGRSKVVIGQG